MFVVSGAEPWFPKPGVARGAIGRHRFTSSIAGDERDFFVYTPPGYDPRRSQPLSQAEMNQLYQNAMRQLNDLRQTFRDDPSTLGDIQGLIREMQRLDPNRFPGNPALVEQLHTQVLASVDRLELQLRREAEGAESGQVRSGDSLPRQ